MAYEFPFERDPVIEAYKKDVDRTLLRHNLRLTPAERCEQFLAAQRLHEEMKRAGEEAGLRPKGLK